jgi:hypothetical protein
MFTGGAAKDRIRRQWKLVDFREQLDEPRDRRIAELRIGGVCRAPGGADHEAHRALGA